MASQIKNYKWTVEFRGNKFPRMLLTFTKAVGRSHARSFLRGAMKTTHNLDRVPYGTKLTPGEKHA